MFKKIVVIAGPSGSGKNTVINQIIQQYPHAARLVTATTRVARPDERDGVDYYFFSIDRFDSEESQGHIVGNASSRSLAASITAFTRPILNKNYRPHPSFLRLSTSRGQSGLRITIMQRRFSSSRNRSPNIACASMPGTRKCPSGNWRNGCISPSGKCKWTQIGMIIASLIPAEASLKHLRR